MSIIFAISGTYQLSIRYTNYVAVVSSNIYSKHCAFRCAIERSYRVANVIANDSTFFASIAGTY